MERGIVAWFSNGRSYGFISPQDGGKDVFVYYDAIVMEGFKTLTQGDKVEFDTETKDGRTIATNVRVVGKGDQNGSRSNSHQKQ